MAKVPPIGMTFYYNAPVATVFEALTAPKQLAKWFVASAEVEAEKGGAFRFVWQGGYTMESRIKSFDPPRKVAFTWVDRWDDGTTFKTLARFDLRRKGKGTLLTLTHKGFKAGKEWIELYGAIQSGWAYFLLNLRSVLEHGTDLRSAGDLGDPQAP